VVNVPPYVVFVLFRNGAASLAFLNLLQRPDSLYISSFSLAAGESFPSPLIFLLGSFFFFPLNAVLLPSPALPQIEARCLTSGDLLKKATPLKTAYPVIVFFFCLLFSWPTK